MIHVDVNSMSDHALETMLLVFGENDAGWVRKFIRDGVVSVGRLGANGG